jgi:hypothetical protein
MEYGRPPVFAQAHTPDGQDARTPLKPPKPPNLRHFRGLMLFRTSGIENYKKGGWHGAQDDLSWQAQNLGSGGGT